MGYSPWVAESDMTERTCTHLVNYWINIFLIYNVCVIEQRNEKNIVLDIR